MNHPIILAALKLRGQWFAVKDAMALCGMSHSTVRHRLEGLVAAGVLLRKLEQARLVFKVADKARLCAIRDGHELMPGSADTVTRNQPTDITLPLAQALGYQTQKSLQGKGRPILREQQHNQDAKPRAGHIYGHSSLEII